jgi:hypothetical protein
MSRVLGSGMAAPGTIMVYDFEYLVAEARVWVRSPVPATMEAISANGWRAIANTGRRVPRERVASNGVALHANAPKSTG